MGNKKIQGESTLNDAMEVCPQGHRTELCIRDL